MALRPQSPISRRAVLRAAGALIALPALDSLLPRAARAAASSAAPQRVVTFYVPCGVHMEDYKPGLTGKDFPISPILTPLAPLKDYVTVVSGLTNYAAEQQVNGIGGDHGRGTGTFGSGSAVAAVGVYDGGGVTFDQLIANKIGNQTRFPSLQLAAEGTGLGCQGGDGGYNCAYMGTISWANSQTPLMPTIQPSEVFKQIFGDSSTPQQTAAQAAYRSITRKSILDSVTKRIGGLSNKLNNADKQKLDQYLTSMREIEREVTATQPSNAPAVCGSAVDPGNGMNFPSIVAAHVKLMTLAVQCDATRVISFMLGTSGSTHDCSFLNYAGAPIPTYLHLMTHLAGYNGDVDMNHGALTVIDTWRVTQIANFATALYQTPEGSGNMLDNTVIYMSSEISTGNVHNHNDMPALLVGKGGGAYAGNNHVLVQNNESLADLYVYMMQQFGVAQSTLGADGTGPLSGLS